MSSKISILASFILMLVLTITANAQLGSTGLSGTVVDSTGAVIGGATIVIKNALTEQTRETITSETGFFAISNLPPAEYKVKVVADGFAPITVVMSLRVGESISIKSTLKPITATDVVEVSASAPPVDTTNSQVSGIVSTEAIANLPLNGRNFLDLALLLPGNTIAPNFDPTKTNSIEISSAGQLGRGGNISVDGADNNDDVVGGTLQNFPQDSVQEFQIATSKFGAEIGRSASSAINIVTKTGTNEFHGSAAFFFRNDNLSALPATLDRGIVKDLGRPPFDREQYAFNLGGPLKRDKAWFFSAFEYRNQDAIVLTGERNFQSQSVVTSFAPAPLNDILWLSRVDWQVSSKDRMMFRYALQREDDIDRNGFALTTITSAANRQKAKNNFHSFVYNYLHTFSGRLLNDFTFQENNYSNDLKQVVNGFELAFPSYQDGGNSSIPQSTNQNRIQIRDNVSLIAGSHTLKFGGEFHKIDSDLFLGAFSDGLVFLLEDFGSFDRNRDGQINDVDIPILFTIKSAATTRPFVPDVDNKYLSFYISDDWKVRPNFTINMGLRYEVDTNVNNRNNFNETSSLIKPLVPGSPRIDKNNFAPRIGFNWDPFGDGRTSIHGGYGIYYDRVILTLAGLDRLLNGVRLPIAVKTGSDIDENGLFLPGSPTLASPFTGFQIPGLGGTGVSITDPRLATPYTQQFTFGIRREITRNLVVSIDGIHVFGSKFIVSRLIGTVFNPVLGGLDNALISDSSAKNWYDGLLINVEKRASKNFSFIASYTLSKALSYSNSDQISTSLLDSTNPRLDKAVTPNDATHRFSFAGVFALPFGIQVSPIIRVESDVPIDILLPDRSSRVPLIQRNAGGRQFRTGAELNAFLNQINSGGGVNGELLPLVRDDLRFGDGFSSVDLRIAKTFKVSERVNIQGIVEAFNLFNVTNIRGFQNTSFSGFQNVLTRDSGDPANPGFLKSSSFGSNIQTAGGVFGTGGPRAFQFALRVNF